MDSPFPGMDPYLEDTDFWPGFHNRFMTYVADAVQPQLPANYMATLEMRVYYEAGDESAQRGSRVPDIDLIRTGPSSSWAQGSRHYRGSYSGTIVEVDPIEHKEAFVLIKNLRGGEAITSVELLSPTNKRYGEGREQYRAKQSQMIAGGVNMVEIDLLRGGMHTIFPPVHQVAKLSPFHYLVSVYRVTDPRQCELFTWTLRQNLPTISIPLAPEDAEAEVDLADVFGQTFRNGAFTRGLAYRDEARPPLAPEDAAWAEGLLRDAGLRGPTVA